MVPDSAVVRVAALARAGRVAEALGGATSAASTIGAVARRHTSERRVATTGVNVWPWQEEAVTQAYADAHRRVSRLAELAGASLAEVLAIGDAPGDGPRSGTTASLSAEIEPGETRSPRG